MSATINQGEETGGMDNDYEKLLTLDGVTVFDLATDQLIGPKGTLRIKPVTVRILIQFTRSPQVLLRRQHLIDVGWRAYGIEVCENSLNQTIHELRAAFAKVDPGRNYIKTVPRLGYVLLTSVEKVSPERQGVVAGRQAMAREGVTREAMAREAMAREAMAAAEVREVHEVHSPLSYGVCAPALFKAAE